ncbi:PREDICTED: uncharacterized protein LOC109114964 [Nelumbo nucifera]|uniref:Uncharacterized protein LOC109114964 n=1 Tax=Nelumbo nucifera TaxID=4432 RepID=A0A1U8Q7J0_NELNU|nr:PREDICTED: uncharacterized protein LOC109114964 [Nelumbo nucifera]
MVEEYNVFLRNGTWELGFHQREGFDFTKTFSPVVKPSTIRLLLTLVVSLSWPLRQIDIQNAFLHGDLCEEVCMSQPPEFVDDSRLSHVCRLRKSLYGLKQAPHAWYSKLSSFLLDYGFTANKVDSSLFILRSDTHCLYILVYVDDIILTGSTHSAITDLISAMESHFAVKDLGSLSFFLGIEVIQTPNGLFLNQRCYAQDLLERTVGDPFLDVPLYCSTAGALQYLLLTRPDFAFVLNKACQYLQSPTFAHWSFVKHILRYLKSTVEFGLCITPSSITSMHIFSDSDWAGCPDYRCSQGSYCIFLGNNLHSWSSRKYATVSRSSTEAKYRSLALATSEALWINSLFRELGFSLSCSPTLRYDNIGATYLSANPVFHARTKHIEIDFHFV